MCFSFFCCPEDNKFNPKESFLENFERLCALPWYCRGGDSAETTLLKSSLKLNQFNDSDDVLARIAKYKAVKKMIEDIWSPARLTESSRYDKVMHFLDEFQQKALDQDTNKLMHALKANKPKGDQDINTQIENHRNTITAITTWHNKQAATYDRNTCRLNEQKLQHQTKLEKLLLLAQNTVQNVSNQVLNLFYGSLPSQTIEKGHPASVNTGKMIAKNQHVMRQQVK